MRRTQRAHRRSLLLFILPCILFWTTAVIAQKDGGQIRYPIPGEPRPLDPQHWYNERYSNIVCEHIYENLVGIDKNSNLLPELATSWKMAPDHKSCTFTLRRGVKFHDGAPFDAKAVEANFNRFTADHPNSWLLVKNWFKSAEVIDDYTIRINLNQVYTPFLTEMTQIYTRMISPLAIKKYGMQLGNNPSGTGPWKFSEWIPGERIVLTRNSEYWRGKPHLDGIVFKITPDITARMMGFESNSFDVIDQPQYTEIERLEKSKKYVIHSVVSAAFFHYAFNCASEPFNQKKVRQAVAYAINKNLIVKGLLGDNVVVADSFGPLSLPENLVKKDAYPYNPERAKEILASLGWKLGPDGILVKDGKRFQFKLLTPSGRIAGDRQISEAIQSALRQIGLDVTLEVLESAAYIKWLSAPKNDIMGSNIGLIARSRPLGASLDWALVQHYHTNYFPPTGSNSSYYSNKELDELLTRAPTVIEDSRRRETYKKAQEILFDELPALPIYYWRSSMFNWPYVKNIDLFPPAQNVAPFVSHETWIDK